MEISFLLSSIAGTWLDETFRAFDHSILQFFRELHLSAGAFFDPFFKFITFLGEAGIPLIIFAVILLSFRKTRRAGLAGLVAILIGAIITNLILKNVIDRARPYDSSDIYYQWFVEVFNSGLSDKSFPSGHATATFALVTALFLACDKRYSWLGFVFGILMAISRIYLVVHYPTDVIAGAIVGITAGICGYYSVSAIYKQIQKHDNKFTNGFLNLDIISLFNHIKSKCMKKSVTVDESESDETGISMKEEVEHIGLDIVENNDNSADNINITNLENDEFNQNVDLQNDDAKQNDEK